MPSLTRILRVALLLLCAAGSAQARDRLAIVGSSTVYPFVAAAAEEFGKTSGFNTPVVEATGTGGGFKLFCAGVDAASPDLANASRPIKESERAACEKNGAKRLLEVTIGYDGIVLAASKKAPEMRLSTQELFLALAKQVPGKDGMLIANPYRYWNEINPAFAKRRIEIYGPSPTSGTRDAFVEIAMEKGCKGLTAFERAYPKEEERKKACHLLREDGAFVEMGENDNLIIQKLEANPGALGIFGYSFFEENEDKVQATRIDGVAPAAESIASGEYPVARSLFVYAKLEHAGNASGLREFLLELTSAKAMGPDGYMASMGLVPLPEAERQRVAEKVREAAGK